jgi:hypothetical protein
LEEIVRGLSIPTGRVAVESDAAALRSCACWRSGLGTSLACLDGRPVDRRFGGDSRRSGDPMRGGEISLIWIDFGSILDRSI